MTKDDRELIEALKVGTTFGLPYDPPRPNACVPNFPEADRLMRLAATRLEALQAQPVGEAHKTEYGWLIELDGPQGLSYCIGSKFDPDHAKALRFARREDAQAFCDQLSVAHTRIAEHGWD